MSVSWHQHVVAWEYLFTHLLFPRALRFAHTSLHAYRVPGPPCGCLDVPDQAYVMFQHYLGLPVHVPVRSSANT